MSNYSLRSFQSIIDYVVSSNLRSYRTTCPWCGTHNSFSINLPDASKDYLYYCFDNRCNKSGRVPRAGSIDDIVHELRKNSVGSKVMGSTASSQVVELLPQLIKGIALQEALEWLIKNNAYEAYTKGYYQVYTDIVLKRVCIPLYDINNRLVNVGGRTLIGSNPKFKLYYQQEVPPFIVGKGSQVIIVEDFASACSISRLYNTVGYALLGTTFNINYHLPYLKKLNSEHIIVALDKDAIKKGVAIEKLLTFFFKSVRVLPLIKDFKNIDNIEELGV